MTREEAKQVLISCRLNTGDQTDPEFASALELALSDPELNQWLNEQQDFHAALRNELRRIRPPAGLKERILAAEPERVTVWQRRDLWAMAASVALLLSMGAFWAMRPAAEEKTLGNFSSRMLAFALRTYQMDIVTPDRTMVREHLRKNGAPSDFGLTPALEKTPVKGGGRLSWHNKPVAMMCFVLADNETAFMFVIDEKSIGKPNLPDNPRVLAGQELHTALWRKNGRIYLLAAPGKLETVAALAAP